MKNFILFLLVGGMFYSSIFAQSSSGCKTINSDVIPAIEGLIEEGVFKSNVQSLSIAPNEGSVGQYTQNEKLLIDTCKYDVDVLINYIDCDLECNDEVKKQIKYRNCILVDSTDWESIHSVVFKAYGEFTLHSRTAWLDCGSAVGPVGKEMLNFVNVDNVYYPMDSENPVKVWLEVVEQCFYTGDEE